MKTLIEDTIKVVTFWRACQEFDMILTDSGREPVAIKAANKIVTPMQSMTENARAIGNLDGFIKGAILVLKA